MSAPALRPEQLSAAFFEGGWQMLRIIEGVADGVIGEFWGECHFTPDGAGLSAAESGVLRFRGEDYHAERLALWRFPEPGRVEVFYEDGRPFHDFSVRDTRAVHRCEPDLYEVSYEFEDGASWSSIWRVTGPAKNFVMRTRFRRLHALWGRSGVGAATS